MQLVPVKLKDLMSREIDVNDDESIQQFAESVVDLVVTDEDLFPAEKADKYIWLFAFLDKEKAYWDNQIELAKRYSEGMEKIKERVSARLRSVMVDDETLYGTREKIVPQDYTRRSVIEELLTDKEFTYNIEELSFEDYQYFKEQYGERLPKVSKKPFTVTKLPEDHPAIKTNTRRLVKVKPLSQKDLKNA